MCAHSFCFCLNQLCCSTEIKADGSCPYKESIQSVHINRQCKMSPPVLAEADPGSGSDGNKTINRVWLGPEQSESSTADMRTHSRHVSREPQTPGTPDPTSICKSVRPPPPLHTKQTPHPHRNSCEGADYCCLQLPLWQSWIQSTCCRRCFCHSIAFRRKIPRELKNMWFNTIMHLINAMLEPHQTNFTKLKNVKSVSSNDMRSWSHSLLSLILAKWPQRSHASHYSFCFLTSPISRSGFNYVLSQRTLLTVFQGHFNCCHCSGRWMQRTWWWSRTVCR